MDHTTLLHLMNLVSPALPIGAYAWSQGLEYAVEEGWVSDERSLLDWLEGVMTHSLCRLDVPVLLRCHQHWQSGNSGQFHHWNRLLLASRESKELWQEDTQTGAALLKLLQQLSCYEAANTPIPIDEPISLAAAFAIAGHSQAIPPTETALGFIWSWAENQVAAAIKLIPLGQRSGQQTLQQLRAAIPDQLQCALLVEDDAIGSGLPGFALASVFHETQYCRLFRS